MKKVIFALMFLPTLAFSATSLKVTLRMAESTREVEVQPKSEVGAVKLAPPKWVMDDSKFKALVKEFSNLPASKDEQALCGEGFLQIEYVQGTEKKVKSSCYNKTTESRRTYSKFARKLL